MMPITFWPAVIFANRCEAETSGRFHLPARTALASIPSLANIRTTCREKESNESRLIIKGTFSRKVFEISPLNHR
jgi:hypothetical protein